MGGGDREGSGKSKPKIQKGDIVIVNTGWHKYYLTPNNIFIFPWIL